MDSYEIDAIKIEKSKAMHRFRTFQNIATTFKILEIFIAVIVISWSIFRSSEYVPIAVELSGAFLRRVSSLLLCPHFVFLVGNVIIVTLFANSRQNSDSEIFSGEPEVVMVAEQIFPAELQVKVSDSEIFSVEPEVVKVAEEIFPAKLQVEIPVEEKIIREVERKTYRRTQSALEKVSREEEKEKLELRRSETMPRRKTGNGESKTGIEARRRMYEEDGLDNEEFRKRVEAFIEKQQKFLREESKAVVLATKV